MRPVLEVSRQRDPTVAIHLPALSEPAAARIDSQLQTLGPDTAMRALTGHLCACKERAAAKLLIPQGPSLPILEYARNGVLRVLGCRSYSARAERRGGHHECEQHGA